MNLIQNNPLNFIEMSMPERQQIGSSTMEKDGTIILRIRMIDASSIGDAEIRYSPDNPNYDSVRKNLSSLKLGTSVPVYNDWK